MTLLTIAIPTYNRAKFLSQLLKLLSLQLTNDIEVDLIVSDNSSTDETPDVVQKAKANGLAIRYFRNESNIGPDRNILQCFNLAFGKYVWVLGDDDLLVDGAISKILNILKTEEYDLVFLSPYSFRHDHLAERPKSSHYVSSPRVLTSARFAWDTNALLTFISSNIVNKKTFTLLETKKPEELIGTNLVQLGWLLPLLNNNGKKLYIREQLVACRDDNSSGWGVCQVFGENLCSVIRKTIGNENVVGIKLVNGILCRWFPSVISKLHKGQMGNLEKENPAEILTPVYKKNWRYWAYVYPVAVLPFPASKISYYIGRLINRDYTNINSFFRLSR